MEANQGNNNNNCLIAPFVMKTYQMVSDPSTDRIIAWGRANNSFTVVDPLDFSQRILPAYFKHNNFSSFVRQLNTYGFRKVDPDKWEFANQWFLRGQKQLLCNITRRKHNKSINNYNKTEMEMDEEELVVEVSRLREEQRQLEEELQAMHRRLEATERRPQQMMAFLYKVMEDPDIIPRMMLDKDNKVISHNNRHLLNMSSSGAGEVEKKRRLMMISSATASSSSSSSSYSSSMAVSSSVKSEDDDEGAVVGVISSPDEPAPPLPRMDSQSPPIMYQYQLGVGGNYNYEAVVSPPVYGGGKLGFLAEAQSGYGGNNSPPRQPLPYPFSLFGGGF